MAVPTLEHRDESRRSLVPVLPRGDAIFDPLGRSPRRGAKRARSTQDPVPARGHGHEHAEGCWLTPANRLGGYRVTGTLPTLRNE